MIPPRFFVFGPSTPRNRGPLFLGGGGRGGGAQKFFAYCGRCLCIWTRVLKNIFLVYGPPNPWRGSRVPTPGTPGRPPPLYGGSVSAQGPRRACAGQLFGLFPIPIS